MKIQIGKDISIEVSTDLMIKIHRVFSMLKDANKVEVEYDKYLLRFWRVDHGSGKKVLNVQVEDKA